MKAKEDPTFGELIKEFMLAFIRRMNQIEAFILASIRRISEMNRIIRMCLQVMLLSMSGTFSYVCYAYSHISHLIFMANALAMIGSWTTMASVFFVGGALMVVPLELLSNMINYFCPDLPLEIKISILLPMYALSAVVVGAAVLGLPIEPFLVLQAFGLAMGASKTLAMLIFFKMTQIFFSEFFSSEDKQPEPGHPNENAFFAEKNTKTERAFDQDDHTPPVFSGV